MQHSDKNSRLLKHRHFISSVLVRNLQHTALSSSLLRKFQTKSPGRETNKRPTIYVNNSQGCRTPQIPNIMGPTRAALSMVEWDNFLKRGKYWGTKISWMIMVASCALSGLNKDLIPKKWLPCRISHKDMQVGQWEVSRREKCDVTMISNCVLWQASVSCQFWGSIVSRRQNINKKCKITSHINDV